MSEVLHRFADFTKRFALGGANDRRDQTFFKRNGNSEVYVIVLDDSVAVERRVCFGNFHRSIDRGLQDEVVHRDLRVVAFLAGGFQFRTRRHQRLGVDLDVQIEVRDGAFALDQTLRNDFAHAGQADTRTFSGRNSRWGRLRLRRRTFRFRDGTHIALCHATIGAGSLHGRKINALFGGEPASNRRSFYSGFITAFSFRRRFFFGRFSFLTFLRRRGLPFFVFRGRGLLGFSLLFLFCRSFCLFFRLWFRLFFLFFLRCCFSFSADERDLLANLNLTALFDVNLGQSSVLGRLPFHGRLVGFNLSDHFARGNLVALLLFPRDESALRHRVAQLRHLNFRHGE